MITVILIQTVNYNYLNDDLNICSFRFFNINHLHRKTIFHKHITRDPPLLSDISLDINFLTENKQESKI